MNKTVVIVILLVVLVGGYFLMKGPEATAPSEETALPEDTSGSVSSETPVPGSNVTEKEVVNLVTYTNAGYSPSTLTIKEGETVTFKNESTQNMWTASAMHPSHLVYSGTSLSAHCPDPTNIAFDACKGTPPGESWSFNFTKTGSWGYHDHLHPTLFGKIIVE